jgi:hypothetical protein
MKTLIAAAILSIATVATALSAHAGTIQVIDPGFETQKLIYMPDQGQNFELACYGCASSTTGRPRTNFVRPHYRSNGTFVDGYYRS